MPINEKFEREITEAIAALEQLKKKYKKDDLTDPDGTATGFHLAVGITCAKLIYGLGLEISDDQLN
jgi:hypothetical protein